MNRRIVAALAVGVAFGLTAVSGAVAFGGASNPAAPAGDTVESTVLDTGNGTLTLEAAPDQTVTGRTDLAAGTTLQVRLQSTNGSASPFLRTAEATVAEDGTFGATVDLSRVGDQPRFVVTVRHDGEQVANATGRVVGEPTDPATDSDDPERVDGDAYTPPADAPETSFAVDGDRLSPEAATGQTVGGETALEPGSEVDVRLRSSAPSQPFLRSGTATVAEDGTFAVTVDLAAIDPGATFAATAVHDGTTLARQDGVVTECTSNCTANDGDWLTENVVRAPSGEVATMALELEDGADAATVTVGSDDANYRITATARDADGDGRVVVTFDTANAGTDDPTLAVEGDDELEVDDETDLASPLDPAAYDIDVYGGTDADGEPVDVGTLSVTTSDDDS